MKSILKLTVLVFLIAAMPARSFAWGVIGHRVIGEIASLHLSAKARKEIKKILGTESIAMASNWGDFIKSDPSYNYLYNWHFINFDDNISKEQFSNYLKNDTAVDAYTKVNMMVDSLRNKNLDPAKKLLYLRMIIHIVGDLHQPMHVGRYSDLGGNRVRVQWFNSNSNLHRVWDEQLVEFQQLSYTEYTAAINHSSKAERAAWQQQSLGDWIYESYQYSRNVYSGIKDENQKLSFEYNYQWVSLLNSQLLKGGVRLAGMLNDIFG